jgi:hypothetical protein
MFKTTRRFLFHTLALAAFTGLWAVPAKATFDLTVTPGGDGAYTFTWAAATTTLNCTYRVYEQYGTNNITVGAAPASLVATKVDGLSIILNRGNGTNCYKVQAIFYDGTGDTSVQACHSYLHKTGLGNVAGVVRSDGNGGQTGFGQTWNFQYFLDDDSLITAKIFPPGTVFYTDTATGFSTTTVTGSTKTIVDSTPRSGELTAGTVSNTETWDSRSSSGAVVANGIYFLYMKAVNPLNATQLRWEGVAATIPVDIIRITNFNTTGIAAGSSVGTINYSVTGDSSIRIVIARPGRRFGIDGNGDVQPLNAGGTAIDTSTTSLVQVITFNRKAGAYSETWNGTDSLGVAVSSAIYPVAISATDGFGNHALDFSGNDGPIQTTLPVDRTASQVAGDVTAPVISAMTVDGTSMGSSSGANFIASNPTIAGPFTTLTITLDETPGTDTNASSITVTGPLGSIAGSTTTSSNSIIFTPAVAQSTAGVYTVTMTLKDTTGNQYVPNPSPRFTISASGSSGSSASQTAEQFKNSVVAYPNPVRTAPARFDFNLIRAATVDVDVYGLTGERIFHQTSSYGAGNQTFNWNLVNDSGTRLVPGVYLVRITMRDGSKTVSATRKMLVTR